MTQQAIYYPQVQGPVLPDSDRPEVVLPDKYYQPERVPRRRLDFWVRAHLNDLTTFTGLHQAAQVDEWFQPETRPRPVPPRAVITLADLPLAATLVAATNPDSWFQPELVPRRRLDFWVRAHLLDIGFFDNLTTARTGLDTWWQPERIPKRLLPFHLRPHWSEYPGMESIVPAVPGVDTYWQEGPRPLFLQRHLGPVVAAGAGFVGIIRQKLARTIGTGFLGRKDN